MTEVWHETGLDAPISDPIICDWCAAAVAGDYENALDNLVEAARQVEFALHFGNGHERANAHLELDRAYAALFYAPDPALAAAARQGGDVKQAPGEASQSGHEVATPNPSSPSHIPLMNKDSSRADR